MGEQHHAPFQLSFNSSLRVDWRGSRAASDGGLIVVREWDEWLGMGALIERYLTDTRRGRSTPLPPADSLRQSVYSRLAGYEDVNDGERVSADPTVRLIGSENIWERGTALTSRWHSFEPERPAEAENLAGLAAIKRELIGKPGAIGSPRGWCWTWRVPRSQSMGSGSTAPTTDVSSPLAITRCCCSTARGTVWRRSCGLATCTAPREGKKSSCPRPSGSRGTGRRSPSGLTSPLPSRRCRRHWRSGASSTPFASRPTRAWNDT
jgi:hypothetical protein